MSILNVVRGVFAVVAISVAAPVIAQEGESAIFEEILVTATKREQTLQEIPVAVSVVGAQTIRDSLVYDIRDLQFLVPSLRVSQLQTSGNTNRLAPTHRPRGDPSRSCFPSRRLLRPRGLGVRRPALARLPRISGEPAATVSAAVRSLSRQGTASMARR